MCVRLCGWSCAHPALTGVIPSSLCASQCVDLCLALPCLRLVCLVNKHVQTCGACFFLPCIGSPAIQASAHLIFVFITLCHTSWSQVWVGVVPTGPSGHTLCSNYQSRDDVKCVTLLLGLLSPGHWLLYQFWSGAVPCDACRVIYSLLSGSCVRISSTAVVRAAHTFEP